MGKQKRASLKNKYDFSHRLATKEEIKELIDFLGKEKDILKKVLVQDFKNQNVCIFTYNYVKMYNDNSVVSMTFRVLKTENGMRLLENYDTIFNFDTIDDKERKTSKGRPAMPKVETIKKTLQINQYIEKKPDVNRDEVCAKFDISKSTYYRTAKWIDSQSY